MRLPGLLTVALAATGLTAADAQEAKHWPLAKISFPVDLAQFNQLSPKPVSIRFYAAPVNGKFNLVANRKPNELDEIVDTKDPAATPRRGFTYTSTADGEEEFAVQYEYADGTLTPVKLTPQYRIKFDTRPPGVKAVAVSGSGIKWQVDDDNLVPQSVRLEGRFPGETEWQPLRTGELKANDSFKWDVPPGKTLEVRVYARDRAGHENRSLPIKLAGGELKADDKAKAPAPPDRFGDTAKGAGAGKTGTGYGGLDDLPANRPKIEYMNTNRLRVSSKITHVTRSGVKAAQLFVLEPTNGADWKAAGRKEGLTVTPDSPDAERLVGIDYEAPRDGLYGFIIQPISGAGTKLDDPRAGDTPQYLVQVDTTQPEMAFKRVNVTGSGLNGPLVEIEWDAKDSGSGFHPEPVVLEYSEDGQKWVAIAGRTANTGRYTWEITNKKLWKFYVRGQASDMAGNTKLVTYSDDKGQPAAVMVDLDKPSGSVDTIHKNGEPNRAPPPRGGINSDVPGVSGGGVTGVSAQPDKLPISPIGSPAPRPADPPAAVPVVKPTVPQPVPVPSDGPPVPSLPPKEEPKKDEPKPADPKKPADKKKTELLIPETPPGEPINLPPVTPPAEAAPVTVPLPPLEEKK
jgi:hypothetical protein